MVIRLTLVIVVVFACVGTASAQVALLYNGWQDDYFDVVHCNVENEEAIIEAKVRGQFVGMERFVVAPSSCGSATFVTDQSTLVFHARAGKQIKVIVYESKGYRWFSSETFKNLFFLLLGATLVGIQDFLKHVFSAPVTAWRLWATYRINIKAFKRAKDDLSKNFELSDELIQFNNKPTAETIFVRNSLAVKIRELINLHERWKSMKASNDELNKEIEALG